MTSIKNKKNNDDLEAHRVNLFLHAENVRVFTSSQDRQLPVTIVTGYLGAGKTTLLHHILSNQSNLRIAAAINDFAALNIDENLIRHSHASGAATSSRVVELTNGCVCCHLLDDLQEAVWKLLDPSNDNNKSDLDMDAVNYLVIETSGVTDPVRIIRTLDAKFGKCFRARLDSVVTVVDADQMLADITTTTTSNTSTTMSQAAKAQLECADVILLNKVDLLQDLDKDCQIVEDCLRKVNEHATVFRTTSCRIPLSAILDVQIPNTKTSMAGPITHEKSEVPIYVSATGGALRSASSLTHSSSSLSVTHKRPKSNTQHLQMDDFVSTAASHLDRPLSLSKLQQFVTSPLVAQQLARMKGVLWIQGLEDYRCILHLSGRGRLGFALDGPWSGPPSSDMAFIGRASNLSQPKEELQTAFANCLIQVQDSSEPNQATLNNTQNEDSPATDTGLEALQDNPEFVLVQHSIDTGSTPSCHGIMYFYLTGSKVYGYTEEEIQRDLRIDEDAMNRDLADAVNASIDTPKAFLTYTFIATTTTQLPSSSVPPVEDKEITPNGNGQHNTARSTVSQRRLVLCYTGTGEPANNLRVLVREAKLVLATHFRNVQVCKCGT